MVDPKRHALAFAGLLFLILGLVFVLRGETAFIAFVPIGIALIVVGSVGNAAAGGDEKAGATEAVEREGSA